ncbi:alpha/beta hydrolase [Rhodovulum sulfidophilum]|uniref:alpha/beta hydrolase n=1 Tax=Rhodovulum sulfidophilum TaxID=35806 RepID=UPI00095205ED|nr:alpha/beta hydrolase [Rhodovulum sulfidophilum]MBL3553541.1 alpha/beta hydrolase [Rhodovulum sulfidophilum]OLS49825.1 lysophospholipase [Rhodovulum sulfidophilum]
MDRAPLYADVADGPADGSAWWLRTEDGVRIRIGVWGQEETGGTVLLFCGRTEYAEKYGSAAAALRARGFATLAVDWRGQGLADRPLGDASLGHVARFGDFQADVRAVRRAAEALGLPRPYHLLAHSMGGAIALRALNEGLDVASAAFSAPMWGIRLGPVAAPLVWALSGVGRGAARVPGTGARAYVLATDFEANDLTGDRAMYEKLRRQVTVHPDLGIAGPTVTWLRESLSEAARLSRLPAPPVPALTFLGGRERIVSPAAIRRRMANWPGGTLDLVEDGRHEILMDRPEIRERAYDAAAAHFRAHGG